MSKEIKVSITAGGVALAIVVIAGAYVLWLLRDLALLVLTAIVIASSIEPGITFFMKYKFPRFLAALIMYVLVFGSFFAILYFFIPPILTDAATFFSTIPEYLNTLNVPSSFSGIVSATDFLNGQHNAESILATLAALKSVFSASSGGVVQLISTFFGGIFSFALVIILSFYFALQETGVDDFLRLVVPAAQEEYAVNLWKRAQRKIGLWMQGQLLLSVIVGVLIYLGLLIIGVKYALLLAVFTAMAEIIPVFGSLLSGAVATLIAYPDGGFALAAITAGLYIVINQFEGNLIHPLIVKKVVGIPPLMVILALIAGGTLAGFLGVLLSVPVAAVGLEFLNDLNKRKRRQAAHGA